MKFIHRLGYYLGGFAIGLIILMFFFSGKNTSCSYGPNARTVKNISNKKLLHTNNFDNKVKFYNLNKKIIVNLIKYGEVDFNKSIIKSKDSCNTYFIDNTYKSEKFQIQVKNCDSVAFLINLNKL